MKKTIVVLLMTVALITEANATGSNIDVSGLSQGQFFELSKELGLAFSYKSAAPATPLGVAGVDIGIEVAMVDVSEESDYWNLSIDNIPDVFPIPKFNVKKGLPLNIDVGAFYSKIPSCEVSLWGADLKWAILDGSALIPALAIRGSYTELKHAMGFDFNTRGLDLSVSKGFSRLTPYAGLGKVWIESEPTDSMSLKKESITEPKFFGGLQISFILLKVTLEAELAEIPTFTLRLSAKY